MAVFHDRGISGVLDIDPAMHRIDHENLRDMQTTRVRSMRLRSGTNYAVTQAPTIFTLVTELPGEFSWIVAWRVPLFAFAELVAERRKIRP